MIFLYCILLEHLIVLKLDISRQNQSHRGQFFGANSFNLPNTPGGYIKSRAGPSTTWWAGAGGPGCGASRQQPQMNYPFPTQQLQEKTFALIFYLFN